MKGRKIMAKNKKARIKKRKKVIFMQYLNDTKESMKNEMFLLPYICKLTDIQASDFTYGGDDRKECKEYFDKVCKYNKVYPKYNTDVKQQLIGGDFCWHNLLLDVKANDKKYTRACFELYKFNNTLRYKVPSDGLVIICFMKNKGEGILVPTGVIEMIANRNTGNLPLDDNFYFSNDYHEYVKSEKENIVNICISIDVLKKLVRYYLAYYCTNNNLRYLLSNGYTFSVDMDKYNTMVKSI